MAIVDFILFYIWAVSFSAYPNSRSGASLVLLASLHFVSFTVGYRFAPAASELYNMNIRFQLWKTINLVKN